MKLNCLLNEIGVLAGPTDKEVVSVTDNSAEVTNGSVFVAIAGKTDDGSRFIPEAFRRGAAAVITEKDSGSPDVYTVADARKAFSRLCAAFYGHPERRLKVIGITGTNGKTTTTRWLAHVLEACGAKCGVIGTNGSGFGEDVVPAERTTPGSADFFRILKEMADRGAEYCAAEISSQALNQSRTEAVRFTLGVFTNLGSDHLDYHGSLLNYAKAKSLLLKQSEDCLLNAADAYAGALASFAGIERYRTYAASGALADYMAKNVTRFSGGQRFLFIGGGKAAEVTLQSPFGFSVENALAAGSAAHLLGAGFYEAAAALNDLPTVKGRTQKIETGFADVYIDYAHTPEALKSILSALKAASPGRLICVFGCGGERDRTKRPKMGEAAAKYADTVIVTNDNPRREDPSQIIADILRGIGGQTELFVISDRAEAIRRALGKAGVGDTVLIAGKGHEEHILINGEKTVFSDEKAVEDALNGGV